MSTELAIRTSDAIMPAMSIGQAIDRYQAMIDFVRGVMHEGADFGVIPGTEKLTLLKPGAEKLCTLFGLSTRFQMVEKEEDWTGQAHGGEPFFYYLYRCQLFRGDLLVAEADGSCNSWESRYRWRWVPEDAIPAYLDKTRLARRGGTVVEFGFAIEKGETSGQYGKPAEYWRAFRDAIEAGTARETKKATRKGATFPAWEIDSTVYRVPNEDIATQVNTIQKMSQKRAMIAAALIACNASEFFTQDLEDLISEAEYRDIPTPVSSPPPPPVVESTAKPKQGLPPVERGPVSPRQRAQLKEKFGEGGAEALLGKSLDEIKYAGAEQLLGNGYWRKLFYERAAEMGYEADTANEVLRSAFASLAPANVVAMFDALEKAQEGPQRQEEEEGIIEADAVREEIPF